MKRLKKFMAALVLLVTAFTFAACSTGADNTNDKGDNVSNTTGDSGNQNNSGSGSNGDSSSGGGESNGNENQTPEKPSAGDDQNTSEEAEGKILVAYFSCTNTTKGVAQKIQTATGSSIYEIVPTVAYTSADLNYNTDCRANREQNDQTARPEISGSVENMSQYDTVFIGYPIWWGQAPKIIYTFLESYDFSGKTIIPFCTSASSGIGSSDTNLHPLAQSANWVSGRRFPSGTSQNTVEEWIDSLNLKPSQSDNVQEEITKMYLTINGNKMEVTLAENCAVDALVEILKQGDITYTADDYGGFEKVGSLGHTLPTENLQITTEAGDVILYSGNQIVLFYGSNAWSYTRLGKINGYSASELRALLCAGEGSVQVTISLK